MATPTLCFKPIYEHDCETCQFLGYYYTNVNHKWDLYYHPKEGYRGTVIARWGNAGQEYIADDIRDPESPILDEAAKRVKMILGWK